MLHKDNVAGCLLLRDISFGVVTVNILKNSDHSHGNDSSWVDVNLLASELHLNCHFTFSELTTLIKEVKSKSAKKD
jgi:hypothetical protein